MFQKNSKRFPSLYDTLVGSSATLDGDFNTDGKVRIDGKIKGTVKINGDLTLGETALILGNVSAGNVDMAGTIEGNVYCKGQLKLESTAKLIGDIQVKGITIADGGHFQGICSMLTLEKSNNTITSNKVSLNSSEPNSLRKKPIINRPQTKSSINL